MKYAVMQTTLERPSTEQLRNAFHQVPGLAAADAQILGRNAFGVLVKGFAFEQASALQLALSGQGVETEVVEESSLPELPLAKQLTRVEFTPEALRIHDFLGRVFPLAWNDVLLIAAGRTRFAEFKTNLQSELVSSGEDGSLSVAMQKVTREEQNEHLLLEIITRGATQRYSTQVDRPEALILFQALGERRGKEPAANLCLFVHELANHAPSAFVNHGASLICERTDPSFLYVSRTAFYREITWLLWLVLSGRVQQ